MDAESRVLSNRLQRIEIPYNTDLFERAMELKKRREVINLSIGEPDFDTPLPIKQAAIKAIDDGFTKYTAVDGIIELKEAIVDKFKRENNLNYKNEQIIVTSGAKQAIFNLILALINPGDEVLLLAPYWICYKDIVLFSGGLPVIIKTDIDQNYKITPEQLEQAITKKTKLFIINTPGNPSGVAYSSEELMELGNILKKYPQIIILSDDIYEYIWWKSNKFVNIVNVCPELYNNTVIINGVSKAYAMCGWRIGYAAGPQYIIAGMKKIQSQNSTCACSISQKAAVIALNKDIFQYVTEMVASYKERYDMVYQHLSKIPGIKVIPSDGTFYSFPNIQSILDKNNMDDIEFVELLLNKTGVAVVPGSAFGCPGNIRISFSIDKILLEKALELIKQYICHLS